MRPSCRRCRAAGEIIDRAMQVHGALCLSDNVPLAQLYAATRALRTTDAPEDVQLASVARRKIARHASAGQRVVSTSAVAPVRS